MKAIICVTGHDSVGIIAGVSAACADHKANIIDITQSVLKDYFAMVMLVEIDLLDIPFADFASVLTEMGKKRALDIHVMHEDIFCSMHRI